MIVGFKILKKKTKLNKPRQDKTNQNKTHQTNKQTTRQTKYLCSKSTEIPHFCYVWILVN